MQGTYGTRFLNQWKSGQVGSDGTDIGVRNAMECWAEDLGGFANQPETIKEALANLPADPPSLPQFVEICRDAAKQLRQHQPLLPAPELTEEQREANKQKLQGMSLKKDSYDYKGWAKKLRAQWLRGENILTIQVSMGSEAMGEVWEIDAQTGARVCRPVTA